MSLGYEKSDVSIKSIFMIALISIIIVAALIIGASQYFTSVKEEMITEMTLKPVSVKLLELREFETSQLTTFGLIDSTEGIFRIPIDEAIKKMVRRQ